MYKGTYYLNNNGSRWIHYPREYVKVRLIDGKIVTRKVLYYESFGNNSCACISLHGKKVKLLPDSEGIYWEDYKQKYAWITEIIDKCNKKVIEGGI